MSRMNVKATPSFKRVGNAIQVGFKEGMENVEKQIDKLAFGVERFSKQITPIKTGHLRNSISVRQPISDRMTWVVGTHNVHYARFVHDGTVKMRARPFMTEGADIAIKRFGDDKQFAKRLDEGFRKAFSTL